MGNFSVISEPTVARPRQENLIADTVANGDSPMLTHVLMERRLDTEKDELKTRLLTMASHAERAINDAVRALVNRDYDLAVQIIAADRVIDALEKEIDELAVNLLTHSPPSDDVRLATATMKICQNLERVGDEATKIANRARDLSQDAPVKLTVDLPRLAQLALDMLKAALDGFVSRDTTAARALIPRDKEVDGLNKDIQARLIEFMTQHPDTIGRCLHLTAAAKSLERVADHAKNIAEEVVYVYEAEDIRHTGSRSPAAGSLSMP